MFAIRLDGTRISCERREQILSGQLQRQLGIGIGFSALLNR